MAYRKKTLRQMLPVTRKVARLRGELSSIDRRLKILIPELQAVERAATIQADTNEAVMARLKE